MFTPKSVFIIREVKCRLRLYGVCLSFLQGRGQQGGAGPELSITKETAVRHGGPIEITSDIRSGTSVFVRLPQL
jgi:hypothetical protein